MGGAWRAAALAAQFGFAVVGSLVGGVFIGQALDQRLGTRPALFLAGLALGFATSLYLIYTIYRVQVQPSRRVPAGKRPAAPGPGATEEPSAEEPSEDGP